MIAYCVLLTLSLLVLAGNSRSFVDTAAVRNEQGKGYGDGCRHLPESAGSRTCAHMPASKTKCVNCTEPVIFQGLLCKTKSSTSRKPTIIFQDPWTVPRVTRSHHHASTDNSAEEIPRYMDDAVKELQNLKNTVGSTLEMMKTHSEMYTNYNGQEKGHSETKEQLNENGRLIASIGQDVDQTADVEGKPQGRVRTKVDIPSKGIHRTLIHHLPNADRNRGQKEKEKDKEDRKDMSDGGNRRASEVDVLQLENNMQEKPSSQYGGIQYSPLDMAEYVFWTGDEKGVTLAIEEFLQEGMMSREEAISFLQDIKFNIDYLQSHYNQLGLKSKDILGEKEFASNNPYLNQLKPVNKPTDQYKYEYSPEHPAIEKKNLEIIPDYIPDVQKQILGANREEEEYGELLERLRVADFLYTEYSLEEVIYQLAKVMFTQSLTRGSTEAQQALQKFTGFLESEANHGRISRALEKKVLDVLIAALTDTLNEHPELEDQQNSRLDQQSVLNELLKYNAKQGEVRQYEKLGKMDTLQLQIARNKALNHLAPLGVGKYKNQ